jgi:hypothetical protein
MAETKSSTPKKENSMSEASLKSVLLDVCIHDTSKPNSTASPNDHNSISPQPHSDHPDLKLDMAVFNIIHSKSNELSHEARLLHEKALLGPCRVLSRSASISVSAESENDEENSVSCWSQLPRPSDTKKFPDFGVPPLPASSSGFDGLDEHPVSWIERMTRKEWVDCYWFWTKLILFIFFAVLFGFLLNEMSDRLFRSIGWTDSTRKDLAPESGKLPSGHQLNADVGEVNSPLDSSSGAPTRKKGVAKRVKRPKAASKSKRSKNTN